MRIVLSTLSTCFGCALVLCPTSLTQAALTIASGLGTTHVGNIVVNGSFELAAPPDGLANANFWANPSNSPYVVPPGWLSSGANSTARWGNDGMPTPYHLRLSDVLPDGRAAVDFHTSSGVTVSQQPTFNANATVTFPAPPTFTSVAGAPVILHQLVHTELTPTPSYNLSFWISGEENSTNQGFTGAGIIGLRLTNVLPGDPIQWLAVPNAIQYGLSRLFEFSFTPLNASQPVDVAFISWGGLDLSAYGMSAFGTQPILDDVIVNAVPEPAGISLAVVGACALVVMRCRRGTTRR